MSKSIEDLSPTRTTAPVACQLTGQEYVRRKEEVATLFAEAEAIEELADGRAYRFAGDADTIARLAAFIAFERNCCPFFTFTLLCEPEQGPLWLRIEGPKGAKAVIAPEVGQE